jgi:transcriptional regulator with XRE-family HTH domain
MSFNPRRLELARKRRGLTKVQLREARGSAVSFRMLAYERGEKEPGPINLERLAQILDFPPEKQRASVRYRISQLTIVTRR